MMVRLPLKEVGGETLSLIHISLYEALGIYLPLITTNCAVLGVVLQNTQNSYNFIESVVYGVTGGLGFMLAIVIFASIRERLQFSEYPKPFEGFPIALMTAGLVAVSYTHLVRAMANASRSTSASWLGSFTR